MSITAEILNTTIGETIEATVDVKLARAQQATTDLNTAISSANTVKSQLTSATSTANTAKAGLETATTTANTAKGQLETVTTTANTAKTNLQAATTTANTTKGQVETATANANTAKTNAETAKAQLDASVTSAGTAKSNLETVIGNAQTAKTGLETSTSAGQTAKSNLDTSISNAGTAKTQLETVITNADTIKGQLSTVITDAETAKSQLDESEETASTTKQNLDDSIQQATLVKNSLDEYSDVNSLREALNYNTERIFALERVTTLEAYIEQYFTSRRTGKIYSTKIWKSAVNPTSEGIKLNDNAGLVCEPSTDTVEGRDDYADIPLFQWLRCNFEIDENGKKIPTVLEGSIHYQTTGSADVGTLFMTPYYRIEDFDDYQIYSISDTQHEGFLEPSDAQGHPYIVVSTYPIVEASDGYWRSQPNLLTRTLDVSSQSIYNNIKTRGNVDGGSCCHQLIAYLFSVIKYGSKNSQIIMKGCTSYEFQYESSAKNSEPSNQFVLLKTQAANFVVGSNVILGYKEGSTLSVDRAKASMRAYGIRKLEAIVEVDSNNAALVLSGEPFTTNDTVDGGVTVPVMVSTWVWDTGTTDKVIGKHDGSYLSYANGKMPMRIHGIEMMCGCYELHTDLAVVCGTGYTRTAYRRRLGEAFTTSKATIETNYDYIGVIHQKTKGTGYDEYEIGDISIINDVLLPVSQVSSNSYGVCDRFYYGGDAQSGVREWAAIGNLWIGAHAGFCCGHVGLALLSGHWNFGGRL